MSAPDKLKTFKHNGKHRIDVIIHEPATYIRLDKIKELIEAERQIWIEQQKDSEIDLNIVALDVVEGQLEGLE